MGDAGEMFTDKVDCRCLVTFTLVSGRSSVETRIQLWARALGAAAPRVSINQIDSPRTTIVCAAARSRWPMLRHAAHPPTTFLPLTHHHKITFH